MSSADDTLFHFSSSIASILPPDLWIWVDVHLSEESLPGILCVQPQMCVSPLLLRWRPKLDGVMPLAWRSFLCCSIVGSLVWSSSAQELIRCMRKLCNGRLAYRILTRVQFSSRAVSAAVFSVIFLVDSSTLVCHSIWTKGLPFSLTPYGAISRLFRGSAR